MLGLACLAVAVRLLSIDASGGLGAALGYDDGVYFAATNALVHGLLPYHDFVFLHPPGILLIGAGPVGLAHWIGLDDAQTLALVRAMFVGLGALNTVLVFLAGRHLSRVAGLSAALLYAMWLPAVRPERSILLEPVVALGTLAALALLPPITTRTTSGWWRPLAAGLLGGLAIATKLWAVVPILVVALGLVVVRRWRTATVYIASALASLALCVTPFLVLTGDRLWQMVVTNQLERPPMGDSRWNRLALILGLDGAPLSHLISPTPPADLHLRTVVREAFLATDRAHLVVASLAAAAAVVAVIVAIRLPVARIWVILLVVQVAVLMKVPTFFVGYPQFAAPALTLVAGAGVHLCWTVLGRIEWAPVRLVARGGVALLAGAALTAFAAGLATTRMGWHFDPAIRRGVAGATCVAADFPSDLALANRLSSNLSNGCAPVVDFTGLVYVMDHPTEGPITTTDLRLHTPQFQDFAVAYFGSADYVILRRWIVDGLDRQTMRTLRDRPRVYTGPPRVYGRGQRQDRADPPARPTSTARDLLNGDDVR